MNALAEAVVRAGLLGGDGLKEFQRWKTPSAFLDEVEERPIETIEHLMGAIEESLQSKELVLVRATDLDSVRSFLQTQKPGRLCITIGTEGAEFQIYFGRTALGEYIFPWVNDATEGALVEGLGHLLLEDGTSVHFSSITPLYFGEMKAFLICAV